MPTERNSKTESLESVFESLHELLSRYAPPFKTAKQRVRGKKDMHLTIPKAVVVPGAYGGKPVEVELASIILQKGYVGFYFMPIYMDSALKSRVPPSLLKLLKGKTCFHIQKLDAHLAKDVETMLDEGVKYYRDFGWLE